MQKCEKCNVDMKKKGVMNAGNSKYEIYSCPKCGSKKQVCIGVNS